jgi:hypothetical protein
MTHQQQGPQATPHELVTGEKCPDKHRDISILGCKRPASTFIPVDEEFALGADAHAWQILKRHHYKGGHRWEPIAWYPTLEQSINGFADRAVRLSCAQTLAELLAESQRVISLICRALPPPFTVEVRS